MNKKKLSALVIARNEEKKLKSCLERLLFADEIIVVLDRTKDNSKAVIGQFKKAKIVEGSWEIEGIRRNYGLSLCKGDWILEVDADEHISKELFLEIREKINNAKPGYFLIPFDNYIGKRKVKYGWGASWGVSAAPRLSFKGCKIWNEKQRIHPSIILKGKRNWIKNSISHYVDQDINDMIKRLIYYTDQKAKDLKYSRERIPPFWIVIRKGITRFFKCFISRKGYKEGKIGFLIATMAFLYIVISYMKASSEKK